MDELVKRLWECASGECFNCSQYTETTNASVCSKELMKQAADAIEELQKRAPPVPHGRLIDADALMLKILDYIEEYSDVDEKGWHNLKWCAMKEAEMAINNAPTVIAAEEGET